MRQVLTLRETQLAVSGIRVETDFAADVPRATRAPVLSKPFTPQALLHAVEQVGA